MILYGQRLSPFVRKALVFAAEKGIAIDFEPGGFGAGGETFARISPFGLIPALTDGDFEISDSSAIVAYIEALHPDPALIPADPRGRARVTWYDEFADTILFECVRTMFWNRFVAPRMKQPSDLDAADKAEREALPPILAWLESVTPQDGFLVGDGLTLADIAVASPLVNLRYAGVDVDGAAYPKLRGWLDRIWARESFAGVVALEGVKKG